MSIILTQPSKMACRTLTLAALLFGRRGFPDVWLRQNSRRPSKRHLVAPFQLKDVPCLVGCGDLLAKSFYNLAHLGDLFCIALGELTRPDPEAVLKLDEDMEIGRGPGGAKVWQDVVV